MPVALNPKEKISYVLLAEREDEKPTTFFFKPASSATKNVLKSAFIDCVNRNNIDPSEFAGREEEANIPHRVLVEYGLVVLEEVLCGWDNFLDAEGRKVPFKMNNRRANIDRLSPEDQEELAAEAQKLIGLTGEESKNSDGLSSSQASPKTLNAEETANTGDTATERTQAQPPSGKSTKKS